MPEIGEVARIVNYIKNHLVGKTLSVVKAQHDENVFGKVGTSAAEFEKALTGKKVLDAKQQGKYFWMVMSSPPHPLMHFGMAGWFKLRDVETGKYKVSATPDPDEAWPPKYWKFAVETAESPKSEAAFVDSRRFARIRLIDCPADEMRNTSPLKENGPDPVVDKDILTEEWLRNKLSSKKIPVKALLLDQANISGIGNWVGDEILYDAKLHPEQYSNTLSSAQISQLHTSLHHVCSLAVDTLADSRKFPETWLFKHRWGKGKKDSPNQMPNGAKIIFLTVGGRTSAVIPSVQKKTGPVAGDVKDGGEGDEGMNGKEDKKPKKGKKRATPSKAVKAEDASEHEADEYIIEEEKPKRGKKRAAPIKTPKPEDPNEHEAEEPPKKRSSRPRKIQPAKKGTSPASAPASPDLVREAPKSKKRKSDPLASNGINADTDPDNPPQLEDENEDEDEDQPKPAPSKRRKTKAGPAPGKPKPKPKPKVQENGDVPNGRRRSKRVSGVGA